MRIPRLRRAASTAALAGLGAAAACGSFVRPASGPTPKDSWQSTLALAQADAGSGQFETADSVLAAFATKFPNTPEALETAYWRALFKLDPTNRAVSVTTAMASLDAYLADKRPRGHAVEAATLRRVAGQLDELNKLAANAMAQAHEANVVASNAKQTAAEAKTTEAPPASADAEIKRLREELAKANAELERIKKRLAQPPPKP